MAKSHIADLGSIIADLEARGRLARVKTEVDLQHDLAGIAARFEGGPRALLFEKVKDRFAPVFTGLYWSRESAGDAAPPRSGARCRNMFPTASRHGRSKPRPPVMVKDGPVFEVSEFHVDLTRVPIPIHALKDGGPYFDAGVVIAIDPETGVRNASIQRFMVEDWNTLHVNIDAGRHLELYLEKAAKLGKTLPFSLNIGVGPGLHFAAATPAEAAPADTDELGIVTEFDGAPLELVEGKRLPVHIVANAMYALECEMIPANSATRARSPR